jgi:glutathione reductase (NADPH)
LLNREEEMAQSFDLIVIGTGSAGATIARRCRAAGRSVAIIDSRPFGGTCSQRGCDPKKVLVGATSATDQANRFHDRAILEEAPALNWPALQQFKRSFTEPVPAATEREFTQAGIAQFHGRARFVDATTLVVADERLEAKQIVIAAGAKRAPLDIPGEERLTSSTEFLALETLPRRIVFIGGGYISFEFAHVAARAGAQVTILHRSERPLTGFDPDLVELLVSETRAQGIELRVNSPVQAITRTTNGLEVQSNRESFAADLVVHGAGRVPEIDDLDLAAGGVERNQRGVVVNDYLQSVSNPAVYAAGDAAASGLPLTPVASLHAAIVTANLLEGNHRTPDYRGLASVVYTIPPLATVGLQEAEARKQGLRFRVNQAETGSWYSSRRLGMAHTGYKILIEEESGRILGAQLLGPNADEVINLYALAIRFGITADELKTTPLAYPTAGSDIKYML